MCAQVIPTNSHCVSMFLLAAPHRPPVFRAICFLLVGMAHSSQQYSGKQCVVLHYHLGHSTAHLGCDSKCSISCPNHISLLKCHHLGLLLHSRCWEFLHRLNHLGQHFLHRLGLHYLGPHASALFRPSLGSPLLGFSSSQPP